MLSVSYLSGKELLPQTPAGALPKADERADEGVRRVTGPCRVQQDVTARPRQAGGLAASTGTPLPARDPVPIMRDGATPSTHAL